MAFIQPCFIKNTPERRAKLELLGVIYDGYYGQNNDFIVVDYSPYNNKYDTVNTLPSNVSYHTYDGYKTFDYMDCGDNEDLFFALAALRDDSNMWQWYICVEDIVDIDEDDGEILILCDVGDWLIYDCDCIENNIVEENPTSFRKATVEEIIEHFNKQ